MKILFIVPPARISTATSRRTVVPSLGVSYIAAYLEKHGFNVNVLDAYATGLSLAQVRDVVRSESPQLVGVTFSTENRFDGFATARAVRDVLPKAIILAGGPHVSLTADDTLLNIPEIDIVVRGEGEITCYELLRALDEQADLDSVMGISYRKAGGIVHTPARSSIANLDEMPFPAFHLLPMDRYRLVYPDLGEFGKVGVIITSRGCPFACNFCATCLLWGRKFRPRSPENVFAEMRLMVDTYGVDTFWIQDDSFTLNMARAAEICRLIKDGGLAIKFIVQGSRVDGVNSELLQVMKEAGCIAMSFGVESGSENITKAMGKRISLDTVRQASRLCGEAGVRASFGFIVSHPNETLEDAGRTLDFIKEIKCDGSVTELNVMRIYPGTEIERVAIEKGILRKDFSWTKDYHFKESLLSRALKGGEVPFFVDRLSWEQIYSVLAEWTEVEGYKVDKHILDIFKSVRSFDDLKTLATLTKVGARRLAHGRAVLSNRRP